MDPLRQLCVWLGVGAGHAALLVALWGSGGLSAPSPGEGCVTVWLMPAAGDEAPASPEPRAATSQVAPTPPRVAEPPSLSRAVTSTTPTRAAESGDSAEAVGTPPRFVERAEPTYPRGARLAGVQGVVRLGLEISASGVLRRVTVLDSSGDASLDRAAMEAAQASLYGPARVSGRAVDAVVEASYRFELR